MLISLISTTIRKLEIFDRNDVPRLRATIVLSSLSRGTISVADERKFEEIREIRPTDRSSVSKIVDERTLWLFLPFHLAVLPLVDLE